LQKATNKLFLLDLIDRNSRGKENYRNLSK